MTQSTFQDQILTIQDDCTRTNQLASAIDKALEEKETSLADIQGMLKAMDERLQSYSKRLQALETPAPPQNESERENLRKSRDEYSKLDQRRNDFKTKAAQYAERLSSIEPEPSPTLTQNLQDALLTAFENYKSVNKFDAQGKTGFFSLHGKTGFNRAKIFIDECSEIKNPEDLKGKIKGFLADRSGGDSKESFKTILIANLKVKVSQEILNELDPGPKAKHAFKR